MTEQYGAMYLQFLKRCRDEDLIGKKLIEIRMRRINPNGNNASCKG